MMVALLVAGIGFVLAGLLGVIFGLPVKEFSFGNTLILAGAVMSCTGVIMLGLWAVVRELRAIAQRLEPREAAMPRAALTHDDSVGLHEPENAGFPFGRDQPAGAAPAEAEPATLPPWHKETAKRDRARHDSPPPLPGLPAEPAVTPRRNLLFSSSRRERERAELRVTDPSLVDPRSAPAPAPPASGSSEPPATFEDAWPHPERGKAGDTPRRSGRAPSTFTDANGGATGADRAPPAANEEPPAVSVLKSGVVDGMAYSLYSDGSIEAQMPEGMMRFASIDELRAHLEQRS
jgi:hypothetical protein